jgi:GT2 family glycosyltransferase
LEYYKTIKAEVNIVDVGKYHFSKNNNTIAKEHARFNRALFLNNDVFINSDIIKEMNKCWTSEVGMVGLRLLYEDGKVQHDGIEMTMNDTTKVVEPMHTGYMGQPKTIDNNKVEAVTGACMLMPTQLYIELGGFDEAYNAVFQDVDLCMRVSQRGYDIINCTSTTAIHIESGTRSADINVNDYDLISNRWGLGRIKK